MKIINYNKTKHDIYKFDETAMVLCALPTDPAELIPGTRTHATVTGWNYDGLWNTNIDNTGIPDWSGLSARSRGSNLYGTPTQCLKTDLVTDFNAGSSDSKFSDITNWNNRIPVFIIISKKHFIACAHFTGTNTTQSFNILNKDGVMYTITGVRESEAGQSIPTVVDTNLYRITSINGTTETEITRTHKIKIYEILNLQAGNWEGLRIWHQLNNGMFVTTTRVNGQIAYNNACEGRSTTPSVASGLPILAGSSTFWTGDSGSPILATYNGETYLIGMSDGGHPYYSSPEAWEFLRSNLANDGIIKTLVDQVIAYNIGTPLSVNSYKSRFTTNTDLLIYNNTYNYVNMIYHGFYGGTSLQSQELNELQENIQNQLSLSNTLTGNWLEYDNNINIHGEILGGIYAANGLTADIFVPLNPKNITDNTTNTHNDWYLYKDNNGYQQFIILHHETVSHSMYYNNIKSRIVSGQDPNWAILKDTNNSTTFDNTGAHRIQLYYLTSQPDTTTQPPTQEQRSQIYAFSWYPIAGIVQDWTGNLPGGLAGVGGVVEVTEFSHVKPMVKIGNDYNIIPPETWQVQVIRDQLRMLDEYNNLPNTNIKNILPVRYHSGWLYGKDEFAGITNTIDNVNGDNTIRSNSGHTIWPDNEIPKLKADWVSYLKLIDDRYQNIDGLRIAKTRLVMDNEYIGSSNNFHMNKPYYDALVADARYNQTNYGVQSLSSQLGSITWDGSNPNSPFCGTNGCGFNTDYLVWNKSVEKIATAAFSEALLTPFQERYANVPNEFRAMNYESNITILGDGYPDVNGHNSYHDNLFGNSANIHLYGRQNPGSNVWCIDLVDDTKLKRIESNETPFAWFTTASNGPWNAFMISVQGVRSVKRGLMDRGLTNTSINAWIAPKDWAGVNNGSGLVGFVNTQYYDEMVRHVSLTGIEVFGFFNGLQFTTTSLNDRAQRRVQFGVINAILVDINDKLGGYTPTTLDDTRVSYNCQFVMSGAPTKDGTYLWRVTPKVSTLNIYSDFNLVPKIGTEIGVWIITTTSTKPSIIIAP